MGPLRRILDRLVYVALRCAVALLGLCPPDTSERLARAVGRLYRRIDRARTHTVLENLRVAFGDRFTEEERARLSVAVFEHFFLLAFEVIWRPRLFPSLRSYRRRVTITGDIDLLTEDLRAGRNAVGLCAHLGNWEFLGAVVRAEGVPVSAVARPIDNPHVNAWLTERRGGPEILIYKRGAVRSVLGALERGRWVAILGDQNAGKLGVFVPFFGVPASTFMLGPTIAVLQRTPVYFVVALRRGRGFRYELRLKRYSDAAEAPDHRRVRERRLVEAYTAQLEAWVRESPEQYFWLHRRWRTRPKGEVPGPHLPRYVERRKARLRSAAE
jgi:Kdo2-lipid IVA lauroyltransferase/acyltransferase